MSAPLVIITGPSASGKSTIADMLCQRGKVKLKRFVTCTTRAKRDGERQHRDYHFMTRDAFEKTIEKNGFFEWAEVYGNYYGSRKLHLKRTMNARTPVLMVLDVQGARTVKKQYPKACIVFLTVTLTQAKKRLDSRKTDRPDYRRRLATYNDEMRSKSSATVIIPNRDGKLAKTIEDVEKAINRMCLKSRNLDGKSALS